MPEESTGNLANRPERGQGASRLDRLPDWAFKLMLLAAPLIWGASFVVMKYSLDAMGPATLVGVRFLVSAALMLLFFFRKIRANLNRRTVGAGIALGAVFFTAYWTQNIGLVATTPGKNAFLTAAYVVMVPFLFWILSSRRPNVLHVLAAVVCLVGIGLVSLDEALTMGFGDAMTLVCAFFFALHISLLSKFASGNDVFTMSFLQFLVCGVLGVLFGLATEPLPELSAVLDPSFLVQMAYLALGSSFAASLLQNVGQTRVNPSQAALILSLEGVFGVLISILIYGERPTAQMFAGFALIFLAIVISEVLAERGKTWEKEPT